MDSMYHRFTELFQQLGLPSDVESIKGFLSSNSPLDASIGLEDAPFWIASQATLLSDEILKDADCAEIVDQLNAALRGVGGR